MKTISKANNNHHKLMVGSSGLEPPTSRLSGVCSNQLSYKPNGGDKRTRTVGLLRAKQALYHLSYTPTPKAQGP